MLVDDRVSTVGTHNFDNRSFRLNFEVMAIIFDEGFTQQMEAMLQDDFKHSEIINIDEFAQKPFLWRLGVRLSYLASPVL
jgi:cardiolipin synthase